MASAAVPMEVLRAIVAMWSAVLVISSSTSRCEAGGHECEMPQSAAWSHKFSKQYTVFTCTASSSMRTAASWAAMTWP